MIQHEYCSNIAKASISHLPFNLVLMDLLHSIHFNMLYVHHIIPLVPLKRTQNKCSRVCIRLLNTLNLWDWTTGMYIVYIKTIHSHAHWCLNFLAPFPSYIRLLCNKLKLMAWILIVLESVWHRIRFSSPST